MILNALLLCCIKIRSSKEQEEAVRELTETKSPLLRLTKNILHELIAKNAVLSKCLSWLGLSYVSVPTSFPWPFTHLTRVSEVKGRDYVHDWCE